MENVEGGSKLNVFPTTARTAYFSSPTLIFNERIREDKLGQIMSNKVTYLPEQFSYSIAKTLSLFEFIWF